MKKAFFIVLGSFACTFINAQATVGTTSNGGAYTGSNITVQSFFRDAITPKIHPDVNGSPFLFENFLLATVRLADDSVFDSIYVKLNACDNKVHFLNENREELQIGTAVDEVIITDKSNPSWDSAIFRSGFSGGGSFF